MLKNIEKEEEQQEEDKDLKEEEEASLPRPRNACLLYLAMVYIFKCCKNGCEVFFCIESHY